MQDGNWDDLRFVLEVAEAGSVATAARRLGVSDSTVVRRIGAAEIRFGVRIFERTAAGYVVPPDSLAVIAALKEARAAIDGVTLKLDSRRGVGADWVRLTTTDTFSTTILPDILADVARTSPDQRIELLVSNTHLDFGRLHADIAIRPAMELPRDMSGEIVADLHFAVFEAEGAASGWIGLAGPVARAAPARWLEERALGEKLAARVDSFPAAAALAAAGIGRAVIPCILAEGHPGLRPVPIETTDLKVPIWVACHTDMADVPRLKRLRSDLREAFSRLADRL